MVDVGSREELAAWPRDKQVVGSVIAIRFALRVPPESRLERTGGVTGHFFADIAPPIFHANRSALAASS